MDRFRRRCASSGCWRHRMALCAVACCAVVASGCHAWHPPTYVPPDMAYGAPPPQGNPVLIAVLDRDFVWEQVVDVVDDYFRILHEERVKQVGDLLTEGRLETYPRTASTLFEPWEGDSVNFYEQLESTLQSIRRMALVRVIPAENGYLVEVQVFKELEDVLRPEAGTFGTVTSATLRNDNALIRVTNPVGGQQPNLGWIPLGRDPALEQVILAKLQQRIGGFAGPRPF